MTGSAISAIVGNTTIQPVDSMPLHPILQESERRVVTVLFVDISGFTAMSEKMDPESLAALMNQCFSMMEKIIEHYGGTIDKFIGDCVMVLFGVPAALEHSARNAVNTAIEIRDRIQDFNHDKRLAIPLDVHIGINTGTVVAGSIGGTKRRDYTVMGDTVNVAARLEGLSADGEILAGPETYAATKNEFRFKKRKPVLLKGKTGAVSVYELLSEKKRVYHSKPGKTRSITSRLIGREAETNLLLTRARSLETGRGAIVSLAGEAGIGKSRLAEELKRSLTADNLIWMEGHAISMGTRMRFHPFIDLFRNWAGIQEEDEESKARRKLEQRIQSIMPKTAEDSLPFILTLMGLVVSENQARRIESIEGEALEILIRKTVKHFFAAVASRSPVVVLLEDLHWADQSSIDLLLALFSLAGSHPILFLVLFRPRYHEELDQIAARISPACHLEIRLRPLNAHHSRKLMENLFHAATLPPVLRDDILARADGNPFFIEEVLRSLIDRGMMEDSRDASAVDRLKNVIIPQTISDVIMERIDRLEPETRLVLRTAAVIGRSFFYKILSSVLDDLDDLDSRLEYLREAQFINRRERMDEMEFIFKHALAQETAYRSILLKKKKELHRAAAAAIETNFQSRLHEFYGTLAFHYSCSEDFEKAEAFMIKAGQEALKTGASIEALQLFQNALNMYLENCGDAVDELKVAEIEKNIAQSLYNKGRHAEALPYYTSAMRRYGFTLPGNRILFYAGFLFSFVAFLRSIYLPFFKWKRHPSPKDDFLIELFYHRIAALTNLRPKRFFMESFYFGRFLSAFDLDRVRGGVGMFVSLGIAFSWPATSFRLSRRILGFVHGRFHPAEVRSRLYYELAKLFPNYYTGKWNCRYDAAMVENGLKIGEVLHVSVYLLFHGRIRLEQGRYFAARQIVAKLSDTATAYSQDFALAMKYYLNTKLLFKYRKLQAALIEADEGISFLSRTGFKQIMLVLLAYKARIQMIMGSGADGEASLEAAEKLTGEIRITPPYRSNLLLARLHHKLMLLARPVEAGKKNGHRLVRKETRRICREIIALTRRMSHERVEAFRLIGYFHFYSEKYATARKWLRKSIESGKKMGATVELARGYMVLGQLLTDPKCRYRLSNGMDGDGYLRKAAEQFRQFDLTWDLNRLEQFLSNPESRRVHML